MLGLELLDNRAVAVAIDDTGRVLGRAAVASADLPAAALATLDGAAAGVAGSVGGVGVRQESFGRSRYRPGDGHQHRNFGPERDPLHQPFDVADRNP